MTLTSIGPANRMARSAETHPLTWRLREDAQPVWNTRARTAMPRRARR